MRATMAAGSSGIAERPQPRAIGAGICSVAILESDRRRHRVGQRLPCCKRTWRHSSSTEKAYAWIVPKPKGDRQQLATDHRQMDRDESQMVQDLLLGNKSGTENVSTECSQGAVGTRLRVSSPPSVSPQ